MKQKLIKIKLLLTFSLVALLLYGCERDHEEIQNPQTTVSHKQFKELIKQENFKSSISQIQKKNQEFSKKTTFGKTIMEQQYGFTIPDQLVNVMQNDTLISYTMLITRDSMAPNEVENLIVQNTSTQTQAHIIKYDSNNLVSSITPINYNDNTANKSGGNCYTLQAWECNYSGHTADGVCTHGHWVTFTICPRYNGDGGNSDAGNSSSSTPSGGTNNQSTIVTAPLTYTSINLVQVLSLSLEEESWINNPVNSKIKLELQRYIFNNIPQFVNANSANNAIAFANWAVTYLMANPSMTMQQFKNWFMGTSEGLDGTYDATYWNNPNLTFPQQALPTLANFTNAYPKKADGITFMTGVDLFPLVGGAVYQAYLDYPVAIRGACALKVSRALNYSGVAIPNTPSTLMGDDGKYYFVNAKALNEWMRKTFGTNPATSTTPYNANHHHFTASQGGIHGENFPTLLAGINGIYSMVAPTAIQASWASGHADLIYNSNCATDCHFYDATNQFVPIDYIDVWELP